MEYLHTMVRVADLDRSLDFYCNKLGLVETRRVENEKGRYTLVFLAASEDLERARETRAPLVELTYNWDEHEYQGGRHHQPPAARRQHGFRPLAGQHLDRAPPARRGESAGRALGFDAEYGSVVRPGDR